MRHIILSQKKRAGSYAIKWLLKRTSSYKSELQIKNTGPQGLKLTVNWKLNAFRDAKSHFLNKSKNGD